MREQSLLAKQLGFPAVFGIAAGAMISSGLFVLPGIAYAGAGPAMILSYGLAALLMAPVLLTQAELATAMPKSGGSYFFIERGLGPLFGTVAGLANWLSIALKSAFALMGVGALALVVYPSIGIAGLKLVAACVCVFFGLLNIISVKETGRLQILLVIVLLVIIGFYCTTGIREVNLARIHSPTQPFMPFGWQSVFAMVGMVFISYGGLTKVVSVAEEIRNPSKNIPLGMFAAFAVVSVLYILTVFVTVGIVDGEKLAGSLTPLSLGAASATGTWGVLLIDVAALLAFITTANAGILAASRTPLAMSRDGLIPENIAVTNKRFGSPHRSIAVTTVFIAAVILLLSIENLIKIASGMMLMMFILQNLSVMALRYSGVRNYRPTFRAPLFPWLQIFSSAACFVLIFEMGEAPLVFLGLFIIFAFTWFLSYVNRKIDRESAFVFLVRRIISSEIVERGLEDELKLITLERDQVVQDRFDLLVSHASVLDIKESISATLMFKKVAGILADKLACREETLVEKLMERERDSSTVIHTGLAIPHIVVEGENIFELALVRCEAGIVFSELQAPVTAAFVLAGSKDERNFHLRALMAIAHVVEKEDFAKRWSEARNPEELKDIILLSRRLRGHH